MEKTRKKIIITKTSIIVIILLIISSFLRLYNLEDTLMFQGDQGRDAYIISQIFKKGNLVFIGPVTSVGNMYLGPFYYYFALPFLLLTYPSPMGPVYMVALLSILAVFLTFHLGRKIIGTRAALIATFLMTFSREIIKHSRFSWNPNPVPLVSLLLVYFLIKSQKESKNWIYVFILISIILQLHYIALLIIGSAALWWFYDLIFKIKNRKNNIELNQFIKSSLIGIFIFALSLVPLILFDLKHNNVNIKAFQSILFSEKSFQQGEQKIGNLIFSMTVDLNATSRKILVEHLFGQNKKLHNLLMYIFILYFAKVLFTKKEECYKKQKLLLISIIIVSLIGLTNYQHDIYSHYLLYLTPIISLLIGSFCVNLLKYKIGVIPVATILIYFLFQNLPLNYLENSGWKISDMKHVSESIIQHTTPNEKYNVLLISESKDVYAQNYRYFLSTTSNPPVSPENHHSAHKLFVINENLATEKVIDLPIYEIVTFPNKTNYETYQIEGGPEIIIFKRE